MVALTKLVARLSPLVKEALENAVGEAVRRHSAAVDPAHWLFHVIFGPDHALRAALERLGGDLPALQAELEGRMPRGAAPGAAGRPVLSGNLTRLLEVAWLVASVELDLDEVPAGALLLAALRPGPLGARSEAPAALGRVSTEALGDLARAQARPPRPGAPGDAGNAGGPRGGGGGGALGRFTVNLTQQARDGALDAVVGRTDEVARAIDVLLRKRQNNPILLGPPGVGKTAIVEGLAQRIVSGEVPEALRGAELLSLDMGLLQAGASVKGEFEDRLKNVLHEVRAADTPIVMFIDEAHTMIGAGGAEGQNDAANLLKPALARGEFRTVAATTFAEYKTYFEKDPALSRRFQPIPVAEPDRDAAIHILRRVARGLSDHHGVPIEQAAVRAAVDLSIRYMPARRLPDKAISVLDTACARVALSQTARPATLDALEERLRFAEADLEAARHDAQRFGAADRDLAALEAQVAELSRDLAAQTALWQAERQQLQDSAARGDIAGGAPSAADGVRFVHPWVGAATVGEVVSDWTGVPLTALAGTEAERLLTLERSLKARVIGQDAAVEAIARSLRISRAGLTDSRKPIGVFLMCGPSGVGKTETALALADHVFGGAQALTTINMTEFKEPHKASMLLGASAGYVGYGKGGVLTEAVRQRPYSVLLLDEMEKAHPAIHDIFFQIFDKGHISDAEGNHVDFRNTIIVMTSNAGGEDIRALVDDSAGPPTAEALADHLRPRLLDHFSPAFLGRTEVIAYRPLDQQTSARLVDLHMDRIRGRIAAQYGATFDWTAAFTDHVVRANTDPLSGGRALEGIINRQLLPGLADRCIDRLGQGRGIDRITVDIDGQGVCIALA